MTFDPEVEALLGPVGSPGPAGSPSSAPPVGVGGGASAMVGGAYDASNRFDTSIALWSPTFASADQDILPHKREIDTKVRDTLRNDAYVAGGANLHRDNIVGAMFLLNAKPALRVLGKGFDETWEEEFQEEVEAKFTLAAESPDNWIDASRMNTLTGLVRLAVGIYVAAGEVLATVEWLSKDVLRPFSTAIQMIDVDRLSNPMTASDPAIQSMVLQGLLKGGVERDFYGAPVAYHIQTHHPAEWFVNQPMAQWKRIPARKPWGRLQVVHIVEQTRPDQTRGVAEMAAALKELRITKKFRDVVLQNAVVNATYAASIESELPTDAVMAQLGEGDPDKALNRYLGAWMSQVEAFSGGAKNLKIDGARIPHLLPGTKLQLRPAGQGGPLGTDFESSLLRYLASILGVSYEQLSRDYTQTNYSSARAAMLETWKFMQARKRIVADRFASAIFRLWLEEQVNKRQIDSLPSGAKKDGWLYGEPLRLDALSKAEWIGASRGQIDELKETQAAVLRGANNLTTDEIELGRLGMDWRSVYRQRAREVAKKKALGIEVQPDAMKPNAANGGGTRGPNDNTDEQQSSGSKAAAVAAQLMAIDPDQEDDDE